MQRTCDGTDEYLLGENDEPCRCGLTFDDVERSTVFPHPRILSAAEKQALIEEWSREQAVAYGDR